MKQTHFRFFKNTPLINFQNTIHFSSNSERDSFFLDGGHYPELSVQDLDFNFIRDRSTIVLNVSYNDMLGVNYCTFKSDFEDTRYYAYVVTYEYLNDNAVRVNLLIDGIMTYTQGNTLETLPNITVQRQHLTFSHYNNRIWELKNNDDIIKTHTKSYFKTDQVLFENLIVLIASSVDLRGDFGNVDDPKMRTSSGKRFDGVNSPLNLYACNIDDFNSLMDILSDYPWISQNINSMSLMPEIFMTDNMTQMSFGSDESLSGVDYLYNISGTQTYKDSLLDELEKVSYNMNETLELFGFDIQQEKHLLRNEYTTTELYNYSGGQMNIDNGKLNPDMALTFWADIITGYYNELKIFVDRYRVNSGLNRGAYVNDSLIFNEFDDVPMLIDSGQMSLAKSANQRQLAEEQQITNRASDVVTGGDGLKDRFMDAASIASNASPANLFGKFNDDREHYRQQKAEQADLALQAPTVTKQTNTNSFNIANDMFGIHIKYTMPSDSEMEKIRKYYLMFGFQINDEATSLDSVDSMSICNFVQFSGSWNIPYSDVSIIEMMKAQFENGVRLWHNTGNADPMSQNVLNNEMVR